MLTGRRLLLAALLIAASTPVVLGQERSPLEPPETDRFLRWGPLRVRPGFTIPALGYDNNVLAAPDASTQPRVGDYFIALAPRLEGLVLFGRRAFLSFDERLEYYAYATRSELDYVNNFGSARLTVPFRRFGFYVASGYERTRDRPYDAQNIRPLRKTFPFDAGLVLTLGWKTDVQLGYVRTRYSAYDPTDVCAPTAGPTCFTVADLNDRTEVGGRLQARYLALGRTRLLLELSRRTIAFDDRAVGRDGRERRQLVGLDFGLSGSVFGTFRVGHAAFTLADTNGTGFNGPVADVELGYRFGGSGSRLTLTAARDVRYTVFDGTPLYTYTGGDLALVKYFNRLIGAEFVAGRAALKFLGDPQNRVDNDTRFVVGVRFRISETELGRRVEYAIRYTRAIVNSTQPGLDQNRGTIGFGASFGY